MLSNRIHILNIDFLKIKDLDQKQSEQDQISSESDKCLVTNVDEQGNDA